MFIVGYNLLTKTHNGSKNILNITILKVRSFIHVGQSSANKDNSSDKSSNTASDSDTDSRRTLL